jgi:hypothetical protein
MKPMARRTMITTVIRSPDGLPSFDDFWKPVYCTHISGLKRKHTWPVPAIIEPFTRHLTVLWKPITPNPSLCPAYKY